MTKEKRVRRDGQSAQAEKEPLDMQRTARELEDHYRRPVPGAVQLHPYPFPTSVLSGLGLSALAGAILGVLVGLLLLSNLIAVPGWEMLYSMVNFTFVVFWAAMGTSIGIVTGGIVVLFIASTA